MARLLIVDDEIHMRNILAANLRQDGHFVVDAAGVIDAKDALSQGEYDVIVTDHKMPDGTGIDVLKIAMEDDTTTSVIFLTAVGSIELAVESMRAGAFDFLLKPFLPEVLRATVSRAAEHTRLLRENSRLKDAMTRLEGSSEIIGISSAIKHVREEIAKVAPTNATALITGETGTGKELVARAIHKCSPRANHSFMAVNCAALSESLLESELFGHERGAFTGADRAREGLFEAAHQGTLFLDEIAELSLPAQAKLLRVLTDGQVTRLGSTRPRKVDVRVIAATHRDLWTRTREHLFREDLYYRVVVFPIAIPPLRDRKEDLPDLCEHFLRLIEKELKVPKRRLTVAALNLLSAYGFPGNVRELRNLLERACIVSEGDEILPEALPPNLQSVLLSGANLSQGARGDEWLSTVPESIDLRGFLNSVERRLLLRTLAETGGAQAEAARRLGLSRSDLGYKLAKHEIKVAAE
jgi:two-component system response regulator HydG